MIKMFLARSFIMAAGKCMDRVIVLSMTKQTQFETNLWYFSPDRLNIMLRVAIYFENTKMPRARYLLIVSSKYCIHYSFEVK